MSASEPTSGYSKPTQGGAAVLAKGLAIIEAFGTQNKHLTIADAARAAGITRASARRCLMTLLEQGYVMQVGSAFHPTPRMLRLGAAYFESASLPQIAQMHLDRARDELQESVSLAVLESMDSIFVARAPARKVISDVAAVGQRLAGYASATGRVLWAAQPEPQRASYLAQLKPVAFTDRTIIDVTRIAAIMDETRENGFAIVDQELEIGMISMAVPVINHHGQTVAAISASASRSRFSPEEMARDVLPVLRRQATALSAAL